MQNKYMEKADYCLTSTFIEKLNWMSTHSVWPKGQRHLWTDAFGLLLLTFLYRDTKDKHFFTQAKWIVKEVHRVLGRKIGLCANETDSAKYQYYHYIMVWLYALTELSKNETGYKLLAERIAIDIHNHFTLPNIGVIWKMDENLRGPCSDSGFGQLDPFLGYMVYKHIDSLALPPKIQELEIIINNQYRDILLTQALDCGLLLWFSRLIPANPWLSFQKKSAIQTLDKLWCEEGYFGSDLNSPQATSAFANYGIVLGLKSENLWEYRRNKIFQYFAANTSREKLDSTAIRYVMECVSCYANNHTTPL